MKHGESLQRTQSKPEIEQRFDGGSKSNFHCAARFSTIHAPIPRKSGNCVEIIEIPEKSWKDWLACWLGGWHAGWFSAGWLGVKFYENHGNAMKIMEILRKSWKCNENHVNSKKIMEIPGKLCKFQGNHRNS